MIKTRINIYDKCHEIEIEEKTEKEILDKTKENFPELLYDGSENEDGIQVMTFTLMDTFEVPGERILIKADDPTLDGKFNKFRELYPQYKEETIKLIPSRLQAIHDIPGKKICTLSGWKGWAFLVILIGFGVLIGVVI